MRSAHWLLPVASCLVPVTAQAAAPTSTPPTLRLPDHIRPLRYSVDLTLHPDADSFTGRIDIDLDIRAPAPVVWLHAVDLTVDSASFHVDRDVPARIVTGGPRLVGLVPA